MLAGEAVPPEFAEAADAGSAGEREVGLMDRDGQALLLLVAVLLRRARSASPRTSAGRRGAPSSRRAAGPATTRAGCAACVRRLDARLRRTEPRPAPGDLAVERRRPVSPVEFLLFGAGGLDAADLVGTLFMPRLMALVVAVACAVGAGAARLGREAPREAARPVRRPAPRRRAAARQRRLGRALAPRRDPARRPRARRPGGHRDAHGDRGAARRPAGRRGARRDARGGCRRASWAC